MKHLLLLLVCALPLAAQEPVPAKSPDEASNLALPPGLPAAAEEALKKGLATMDEARRKPADAVDLAEQAIESFRKAERMNGKAFALCSYHLGIAHQWTKEYKEAQRRLERALELNPKFHEALVELGDVFAWQKSFPAAIKTYDRAIAMKPDFAVAHLSKALSLCRTGEFAKAAAACEKAGELDPKLGAAKAVGRICEHEVKGPGWAKTFTKESEHFLVMTDADQKSADWISGHVELIYAKYNKVFPPIPKGKDKFRVILFADHKGYMDYGSPPGTGGYYQSLTRKLVLYKQPKDADTILVTYHEAFHQYLDYYLSDAPQWFNEGHGDYFGPMTWNEKTRQMDVHTNSWRFDLVKAGIRANKVQSFPKIMTMTQGELYDKETVGMNYAQSWAMVYFFWHYENGKYAKYLQEYFKELMKGEGLRGAYNDVFGKAPMAQIEQEWRDYILALKAG